MRSTTNETAAEGVRVALKKLPPQKTQAHPGVQDGSAIVEVDCLTVEEEQRLVGYYCLKAMQFADFCKLPANVKVLTPFPRYEIEFDVCGA